MMSRSLVGLCALLLVNQVNGWCDSFYGRCDNSGYGYGYNNGYGRYNNNNSITYTGMAMGVMEDGEYGMIPVS